MLTIPFVGLSIVAHIAIIIFYTIFRISPDNQKHREPNKILNKFFGFVIIIFIFSFVIVSGGSLVLLSVMEKHSTIVFIKDSYILPNLVNGLYSITIKINHVS